MATPFLSSPVLIMSGLGSWVAGPATARAGVAGTAGRDGMWGGHSTRPATIARDEPPPGFDAVLAAAPPDFDEAAVLDIGATTSASRPRPRATSAASGTRPSSWSTRPARSRS